MQGYMYEKQQGHRNECMQQKEWLTIQQAGMRKSCNGLSKKVCKNSRRNYVRMYEKKKHARKVARNYPRQCAGKAFKNYSRNYTTNVAKN